MGAVNLWQRIRCRADIHACVGPRSQLLGYKVTEGSAGCLAGAADTVEGSGGGAGGGAAMGKKIGELAVTSVPRATR